MSHKNLVFLINRTDAIGDTVLTMPIAYVLKKLFPGSKVIFLISGLTAPLFENHRWVDSVLIYNKSKSFLHRFMNAYRLMSRVGASHYFYIGGSHLFSFFAWINRVPFRGGLLSRFASFLWLNRGVRQKRSLVDMHEVYYNIMLLGPLKQDLSTFLSRTYELDFGINFDPAMKQNDLSVLRSEMEKDGVSPQKPYIVFHPGMTGHTLNWPIKNYALLLKNLLSKNPEFNYVVSYTPADLSYIQEFKNELKNDYSIIKNSVYFLDGSVHGLRFYFHILSEAHIFVGPSTGPTHLSAILKRPQVALYSPIKTQSALRWGPFQNSLAQVVVPSVVCGEILRCAKQDCPYYECMGKIEVEDVASQCEELLNQIV